MTGKINWDNLNTPMQLLILIVTALSVISFAYIIVSVDTRSLDGAKWECVENHNVSITQHLCNDEAKPNNFPDGFIEKPNTTWVRCWVSASNNSLGSCAMCAWFEKTEQVCDKYALTKSAIAMEMYP